jgi:hypothetical protein
MSLKIFDENTIIKCTNKKCLGYFSVICYTFEDEKCTKIANGKMIPLTGNVPYYCPCCGTNLGKE